MHLLLGLLFREIFSFHLVQTDPNFANYRYNHQTQQLILLDFGATREIPHHHCGRLSTGMQGQHKGIVP